MGSMPNIDSLRGLYTCTDRYNQITDNRSGIRVIELDLCRYSFVEFRDRRVVA